jgi:hypothetical protein
MAMEQSPYGVARHYKVGPWSEDHLRLLGRSCGQLGRVGNDLLIVPVVCKTEFGNEADSPIGVLRGKDGKLALGFTVLDRYLDVAVRHWGKVRYVVFVVDHAEAQPVGIRITDGTTGTAEPVDIGPKAPEAQRRGVWQFLASGIYEHMRSRGMAQSVYWGLHGDIANDPTLPKLLKEFTPAVTWFRCSHRNLPDETYTLCGTIRTGRNGLASTSRMGWKSPPGSANLWIPRNWNDAAVCYGTSEPFAYRLGVERALVAGMAGVGRFGADYWDSTWLQGFPRCPYAGLPVLSVLWPGPDGAEPSTRFEMLCEGLQEAEARIFLEQATPKLADDRLARQTTDLLNRRMYDTLFALCSAPHAKIEEYSSG